MLSSKESIRYVKKNVAHRISPGQQKVLTYCFRKLFLLTPDFGLIQNPLKPKDQQEQYILLS